MDHPEVVLFVLQPSVELRRVVFLSGMSGEEVSEVIGSYNDSGKFAHRIPFLVWSSIQCLIALTCSCSFSIIFHEQTGQP